MSTVLTVSQAKQITGGRTPLVPVEYEAAVNALQACVTLDEAKYWSDKSDALAAWARIYHNDKASIEARRLKLHAFRRMGELAGELRPQKPLGFGRTTPGPRSLLLESGLSRDEASASRKLAKLPEEKFAGLIARPRPPSPHAVRAARDSKSKAWNLFMSSGSLPAFRTYCRAHDAAVLARGLTYDEAKKAKEIVVDAVEWLDEFDQVLQSRLKAKK